MHEHLRLRAQRRDQKAEGCFDDVPVVAAQRAAEMAFEEPRRHQLEFLADERFVERRQAVRGDLRLHLQQRVERVSVQRIDVCRRIVARLQFGQVGAIAEILHQDEPLLVVDREHVRRVQTDALQALADVDPRLDVLEVGRRVHDDLRVRVGLHSPVAAEARVGGGET